MFSFIPNTNSSTYAAAVTAEDDTRAALNSLTLSDEKVGAASTTSSNSIMKSSLMDSATLGLQEIASSVISELQKDPKKKEVIVHVRVMRLCKDKKNKKCYTKAKITKLSYRLKVNQKVLQKIIQKQENIRKISI